MPKTIQIASDLHIDVNINKKNFLKKTGDILCLTGDICSCGDEADFKLFTEFLERECRDYEKVLHIAGNHEFYSTNRVSMEEIKLKLKNLETIFPNYLFLDDEIVEIQNDDRKLVFIGTTLWSHIPDQYKKKVKNSINDYRFIHRQILLQNLVFHKELTGSPDPTGSPDSTEPQWSLCRFLSVEDTQSFHNNSTKFIFNTIETYDKQDNVDIVLLTHHKPIWDSPLVYTDYLECAFQTELEYLLIPPIRVAVHGHTHKKCDKIIKTVRVLSNPHGYVRKNPECLECPDFNDSLVFEL